MVGGGGLAECEGGDRIVAVSPRREARHMDDPPKPPQATRAKLIALPTAQTTRAK